jgi:hypothetical protein
VKLKVVIIVAIVSLIANIAMLSNIRHPFQDPLELMRAMQMGWSIRGLAEHNVVDVKDFEAKCILGIDYDKCREAEGGVVIAVRHKYGIMQPLPIPTAQSSTEAQRP